MTLDISRPDLCIAVVGTGVMGRGIAQIAAQAGIRTFLFDSRPGAAAEAKQSVATQWQRLAEKGRMTADAVKAATDRLEIASALADLAPCHVVIEAIVEILEAKRALFAELEAIVGPTCILASNTSSLQVTAIAAKCKHPERVAGYHFFNPVPLMKVVEVVDGLMTAPWVCDALTSLSSRCGHKPVRAKDTPGFIVNHAGRGYGTEALRIAGEGIADFYDIDRVLRDAAGFRMGPFELFDLTGLDVSHPVMESIYHQYYEEPRYTPSTITAQRVSAGVFGRKSAGRGFYVYPEGKLALPPGIEPEEAAPAVRPAHVWISERGFGPKVKELAHKLGAVLDHGSVPSGGALCVVAPIGQDATTAALAENLDPTRTVAIDGLLSLAKRRTLMTTPVTRPEMRAAAHGLFASDGVPVTVIHDSPGFIAQRVLSHIVNVACDIAQQRIATTADIDAAVTLGLGYPQGPLAWGDALGAGNVLAILDAMQDFYRDPRYRASPWLRRRALLGVSLSTSES